MEGNAGWGWESGVFIVRGTGWGVMKKRLVSRNSLCVQPRGTLRPLEPSWAETANSVVPSGKILGCFKNYAMQEIDTTWTNKRPIFAIWAYFIFVGN
jgi:hypothetical protein